MESKPVVMTVVSVTEPREIKKTGKPAERMQQVIFKEPGYMPEDGKGKARRDGFFQIEIWNSGIEKFNLLDKCLVGEDVMVSFWVNPIVTTSANGPKFTHSLAIQSIKPVN